MEGSSELIQKLMRLASMQFEGISRVYVVGVKII